MKTLLYVNNIPYSVSKDEILQLFEEYGKVKSLEMFCDPETDVFLGYCLIEMETISDAKNVIKELHKKVFQGKHLRVSYARESEQRKSSRN